MRKFIVLKDEVVVREYTGMTPPQNIPPGQILEEVDVGLDLLNTYRQGNTFHKIPPRPSRSHTFFASTGEWSDTRGDQQKQQDQWALVREERNELLSQSDFSQLPDSPKNRQAWAAYRQALRDITQQPDPFNLTWPTPPLE